MQDALINICITACNRLEMTKRTIRSVRARTRTPHLLTVVDNGSTDGTREFLQELKASGEIDTLVLFRRNMGVACAANMAFDTADTPLYMKLDNDMEIVRDDWLDPVVALWRENSEVSIIGPKFAESRHPFEKTRLASGAEAWLAGNSLSGAALVVSRDLHRRLGYFCEDYGLYGEEDADYSHRARVAGELLLAFDAAEVVTHLGGWAEDAAYANFKRLQRHQNTLTRQGVNQFQLNCYLYSHGLLPEFVPRKYLVSPGADDWWNAALAPGYLPRTRYVRLCKQILDTVPERAWLRTIDSPKFLATLRGLGVRQGVLPAAQAQNPLRPDRPDSA